MARTLKRRRREAKTDYKSRLNLLKSEKIRLVVRKTNRYIIAQFVESDIAKDKILFGISSKDLLERGWSKENIGSLKNKTAGYLTGAMIGKLGKEKIKEAILDIGMNRNVKKSRIYSVLKGVLDAGIKIPHSKESLPELNEIKSNKKTEKYFDKILKEIEK